MYYTLLRLLLASVSHAADAWHWEAATNLSLRLQRYAGLGFSIGEH